jgi:hypothetical protein
MDRAGVDELGAILHQVVQYSQRMSRLAGQDGDRVSAGTELRLGKGRETR